MGEDRVQSDTQLLRWMFQKFIEPHVRQWCGAVFVAFLERFTPGCFPLKSLSWNKRSKTATEQATLEWLSVLSASGMNNSSSLLFFLLLLLLLSFLSWASRALVREAHSLKGDWKARARLGS
jgi:hypothetical protein